jgi:hypothetical protein
LRHLEFGEKLMPLELKRVAYEDLNSRQQEGFNFQKVSAVLADFGYVTIRLTSDWSGADFIAQHLDGVSFLKVQLKGRLTFAKKYCEKGLFICFRDKDHWYLYPHDEVLEKILEEGLLTGTSSWDQKGGYDFPYLTPRLKTALKPYLLEG